MSDFVLVLGYFDSVHKGHISLISEAKVYADKIGAQVKVATFDDGFLSFIGRKEKEIYSLEEKTAILRSLNIDEIIVFPSTKEFLSKSRTDFCQYIVELSPKALFVGSDYTFGKNAEGDVSFLKSYVNIPVIEKELLIIDAKKVSASEIRKLVSAGEIQKANELLFEPYFICGEVKEGRKEGRKIDFPTINIFAPEYKLLPKPGVYATVCVWNNKSYSAVTNVGTHPTFKDDVFNVETHLIGFSGDLYGEKVKIYFYSYLRGIKRFSDEEELKNQIKKDIIYSKEFTDDKIRSCGK